MLQSRKVHSKLKPAALPGYKLLGRSQVQDKNFGSGGPEDPDEPMPVTVGQTRHRTSRGHDAFCTANRKWLKDEAKGLQTLKGNKLKSIETLIKQASANIWKGLSKESKTEWIVAGARSRGKRIQDAKTKQYMSD